MIPIAAILLGTVVWVWAASDPSDDGVDVALQRLAERRGTAARIDPGVALAEREIEEC